MGSRPSCVRHFIVRSWQKCNVFSRVGVQTRNRRWPAYISIVTHSLQYSRVYDLHPSQTTVTLLPTEVKNWAAIMTWSSCLYANGKGICLGIPLQPVMCRTGQRLRKQKLLRENVPSIVKHTLFAVLFIYFALKKRIIIEIQ